MHLPRLHDRRFRSRPVRALILDMDGTIVDTRAFHMRSWRVLVGELGLGEREYQIAEAGFGKTNWMIFSQWWPGQRPRGVDDDELSERKESIFRELIRGHVVPRPGFQELIELALRNGIKLGLATSSPKENALFLLEELGVRELFGAVTWGWAGIRSKPHPDSFLLAARLLEVPPVNCLGYEDSDHGLLALRRAGMGIVGIAERPLDLNRLRLWTPYVFSDFLGATRMLQRVMEG